MNRPARLALLAVVGLLVLSGCRIGGTAQVIDDRGGCSLITVPTLDVRAPSQPTTLPGVRVEPCPTSTPRLPSTTAAPAPSTTTSPAPPASSSARPTTPTTTRTTRTTRTTPPATGTPTTDGATAAALLGWGRPTAGDEFGYTGRPDPARWGVYDGPGHAGNGRRTPAAFSVDGSVLRVHGDERGNSGGMAYLDGQMHGRWETRMRAPAGDGDYHPVLLLWPDAESWPVGGEIDYAEISGPSRGAVDFFLHYGASNSQTYANKAIDVTAWHNYAVDWSAGCVTGYIDGQRWFRDCTAGHLPPGPMHATIQLDAFDGSGPYAPSDMYVDWIRQYAP